MASSLPVGVFDSGVGGLSILGKIHQLLPRESLLYVADSAHAPYGPKGDTFIIDRSSHILDYFSRQSVKAVVLACNTATAAAIAKLREEYSLPIIGMEPAVKPASDKSASGVIGVLATEGTLASDKFVNLKNRIEGQVEIITVPCPGLVEQIEQSVPDQKTIVELLYKYIAPLLAKKVDTIVLGCTHYSLIVDLISEVAGENISVVDTDDAVARQLGRVLTENDLLSTEDSEGVITFYTSGQLENQQQLISKCWGKKVEVFSFQ